MFVTCYTGRCSSATLLILITGVARICERKLYSCLHVQNFLRPKFAKFCVILAAAC